MRKYISSAVLLAAIMAAGCNQGRTVVGPTPVARADAAPIRQTTTTAAAPAPAPTLPGGGGGGVAADPPPQALPNCAEADPKKWIGFAWAVTAEEIAIWNNSPCVRVTTWRAFSVGASTQDPAGPDMAVTVPAFAGFTDGRPYRVKVVYYGDGKPPCGATIQIDGRAGVVVNMRHENASFTPGALFRIPPCAPRNDPPKVCTAPDVFGPWVPVVPVVPTSTFSTQTIPVSCPKQQRTRTTCSGAVTIEPRPEFWCLDQN